MPFDGAKIFNGIKIDKNKGSGTRWAGGGGGIKVGVLIKPAKIKDQSKTAK